MEKTVSKVLLSLHVPPSLLGYGYIKCAVLLCMSDSTYMRSITTRLYPDVAKAFDTTPVKAERAIRHAIASGLATAPAEATQPIFGAYTEYKKPTNSHFIAAVAEHIRLEGK